ncbi:unnamed protein product [Protopolystoma xenopodis]|uniref:Uncharacterized protein n=1 Tax=Protopolystoma xenopodis TaxID=117903 RepID=A0A448X1Q5_9PLAT|nr:unnamed protein product [Protopolystoma xenopodis]
MPLGEATRAVCLVPLGGNTPTCPGYAAVATSHRLLRFFVQPTTASRAPGGDATGDSDHGANLAGSSGLRLIQAGPAGLPPVCLPGYGVVAMAAHPSRPVLAVVVAMGNAGDGELSWRVYWLDGLYEGLPVVFIAVALRGRLPAWTLGSGLMRWQPLPISPSFASLSSRHEPTYPLEADRRGNSRLAWIGFSDCGGLFTHDSTGFARRLMHRRTFCRGDGGCCF